MKNSKKEPQFLKFLIPIIEVLKELGGAGRPSEIRPLVTKKLKISESEIEKTLESGVSRVYNQIDWARNYLKEDGFISAEERGIWRLTEKGFKEKLTEEKVLKLFKEVQSKFVKKESKNDFEISAENPEFKQKEIDLSEEVPEDEKHQHQLLNVILSLSPYGFEKLCKRLLIEEGFENVEVTKKSRDGGIDGIANLVLNRFISFKVFFQCKKYKGKVGSESVQLFKGALDGKIKPGDKGIIITTGYFTSDAKKEASKEGGFPIELIDGEKLVEMFELRKLGLKPKTIYEIDYDFFKEFND